MIQKAIQVHQTKLKSNNMNKYLYFLIFLVVSCAKEGGIISETIVDFEILNNNSSYITPIEFKNNSKFATGFVWYFGDGDTSLDVQTKHLYKNAGTFVVSLKAYTDAGIKTVTKTVTVTNDLTLVADFSFTCPKPFVDVALTTFTNLSKNAVRYKWDFTGEEDDIDTTKNPTFTFYDAQTYMMKLTAYNAAGDSQTISKPISIKFEADSMIITQITLVNARTDISAGIPIDMDSDPDYIVAIGNWIDTSKFRTYMILNNKNFPLVYDLSNKPIRLEVPEYSTATRYNPITIFDGDQNYEKFIESVDFYIRDYLNYSTTPYPDEIEVKSPFSPIHVKLKVIWK